LDAPSGKWEVEKVRLKVARKTVKSGAKSHIKWLENVVKTTRISAEDARNLQSKCLEFHSIPVENDRLTARNCTQSAMKSV
jgi:hypothetical protein